MNLFNDEIIKDTVNELSYPITLNSNASSVVIEGFITNATLSPNSSYHLHSLDEFKRGDYFTIDGNNYYMVTGDVIQMRGSKYKATADFCNTNIPVYETKSTGEIIGRLPNGQPIYKTEKILVRNDFGIFRHQTFSISSTGLLIPSSEIILTVQDNADTKSYYAVNNTFTLIDGTKWQVVEVFKGKIGLLELRLKSTT